MSLYADQNVGYDDVAISNSEFYGNQYSGISISAAPWQSLIHSKVTFDHVDAHDNPGYSSCSPHCGHGIVLGQVDGGIVENSIARSNGATAGKGNVGIWTWQSNNVNIQHNLAYGNRSPSGGDGGGFDLDGGVTNSVVQYNASHDNDGAGLLLAEFDSASPMSHNVFRYNLSKNDGRDGYGGITVWGATSSSMAKSAVFHNNTVVVDQNVAPNSRGPVSIVDSHQSDVQFINNALVALNGAHLIDGNASRTISNFITNDYWTNTQPIVIGGNYYPSIANWSAASGQEIDSGHFVGLQVDPAFSDSMYRLSAVSHLIDEGYSFPGGAWPSWMTDIGSADLYGIGIPQGVAVDIGAAEFLPGDFNRDGSVDAADYVVWRNALGTDYAQSDYGIWRAHFGHSAGSGSSVGVIYSVRQPSTLAIVFTGAIALYSRRGMQLS